MGLEGVMEVSLCRHDWVNHWLLVIINSISSTSSYPLPPKLETEAKVSWFWSRLGLSYSQSPSWSCVGAGQGCSIRKKSAYHPYHSGNSKVLRALCEGPRTKKSIYIYIYIKQDIYISCYSTLRESQCSTCSSIICLEKKLTHFTGEQHTHTP